MIPKADSIPINGIDWAAYRHDLAYKAAGDDLAKKHEADRIMIQELDALENLPLKTKLTRFMVKKILQSKVKFGLGINASKHGNNCVKCLKLYGSGMSEELAKIKHAPYRKPKFFRKIINTGKNDTWYADIMVMPVDKGYKYILNILDGYTRYAWSIPLKSKKGEEVYNAFKSLGVKSDKLCVDEGKEFYNSHMYKLYNFEKGKERIKNDKGEYINEIFSIYGESKNALIERFNRTMGNKLWYKFSINGNQKWVNILKEVINEYNNSIHSSIKMTPTEAYDNPEKIKNIYNFEEQKSKFKVGDKVYIYKWKDKMKKEEKDIGR